MICSWRQLDRRARVRALIVAGAGYVAPWITGAGVKLYLDARARPTLAWLDFLNPAALAVIVPATAVWASPFFALALIAVVLQRLPEATWLTRSDRWFVVYGALLLGLWGEVRVFVEVFWVWDAMALFVGFLLPLFYVPHMLAGAVLGAVIAVGQRSIRTGLGAT